MLNSPIINTAIGLVFTFLTVCLLVSAISEAISSILKLRHKDLVQGIMDLVRDPQFSGLAKELYKHIAINPRGDVKNKADPNLPKFGTIKAGDAVLTQPPAYIDPKLFAGALMELTTLSQAGGPDPANPQAQATFGAMKTAVDSLATRAAAAPPGAPAAPPGAPAAPPGAAAAPPGAAAAPPAIDAGLIKFLDGVVQRSQGDLDRVETEIEQWFDAAMDRVSGAYKRRSQWMSLVIAFVVAGMLNVDSIRIASTLWKQPVLADSLPITPDALNALCGVDDIKKCNWEDVMSGSGAAGTGAKLLKALPGDFPIGWDYNPFTVKGGTGSSGDGTIWVMATTLLGWLITAAATLFGAPFWFDLLQSFVRLKGAGVSPQEKKEGRAAPA